MSQEWMTKIPNLTPVEPWPTRKLPQDRFDAAVKKSMGQMHTMVDDLNNRFVPAVNGIIDNVNTVLEHLPAIDDAANQAAAAAKSAADAHDSAISAQAETDRARAEAERAKREADRVVSAFGTGKCPHVTVVSQADDEPEGTVVATPVYYPYANGLHVYYDGLLLTEGLNYIDMPPGEDGATSGITVLFDIEAGAIWEFHIWVEGVDPEGGHGSGPISMTTVIANEDATPADTTMTFEPQNGGRKLGESDMTFFPKNP